MTIRNNQQGFTIVELMIATAVFSVVLLLCTFSLIYVGRLYYKGVTASKTQEVTRSIMDEVTQAVQFSGSAIFLSPPTPDPYDIKAYCIGGKLYTYKLGEQLTEANHALIVDDNAACNDADNPQSLINPLNPPGSKELLSQRMRLSKFDVQPISGTNLYKVTVKVVHGDDDLLENVGSPVPGDLSCKGGPGSQFCATSELTTTVQKRVK